MEVADCMFNAWKFVDVVDSVGWRLGEKLIRSRIFAVIGTTYLPLYGCEVLLSRRVYVF